MFLFGTIQIHKNKNNLCTEDFMETYFTRKITHEKKKYFFPKTSQFINYCFENFYNCIIS